MRRENRIQRVEKSRQTECFSKQSESWLTKLRTLACEIRSIFRTGSVSAMEKSMKHPYYKDITSRIELFDIELLNKNESLEDYENRVIRKPLLKKLTKRHHVEQLKNRLNNINIQRNEIINQIKNLANY